jgi:hypothetical protein
MSKIKEENLNEFLSIIIEKFIISEVFIKTERRKKFLNFFINSILREEDQNKHLLLISIFFSEEKNYFDKLNNEFKESIYTLVNGAFRTLPEMLSD